MMYTSVNVCVNSSASSQHECLLTLLKIGDAVLFALQKQLSTVFNCYLHTL